MNAPITFLAPFESALSRSAHPQPDPDVLLFATTDVRRARKRLLRFRAAFLRDRPANQVVVVTFDAAAATHVQQIVVDGVALEHYVFGIDAIDTLGYPDKGAARPFRLDRGNDDLITLLFRRCQPQYRHYWFIEDAVDYTGDPAVLFDDLCRRDGDLLATHLAPGYDAWAHAGERRMPGCDPDDNWLVFLPFYRVGADALDTIDAFYRKGWSGHHENLWATILIHAGRTIVDIGGQGDYVAEGDRNRHYYGHAHDRFDKNGSFGRMHPRLWPGRRRNALYYPVEPFAAWARQRGKRVVSQCRWAWARFSQA